MAVFGQQVEVIDLPLAHEDATDIPDHALVDHPLPATEPVEDLQRALGEAIALLPVETRSLSSSTTTGTPFKPRS